MKHWQRDPALFVLGVLALFSLVAYVGLLLRGHTEGGLKELTVAAFAAVFGYARRDTSLTTLELIEKVRGLPLPEETDKTRRKRTPARRDTEEV